MFCFIFFTELFFVASVHNVRICFGRSFFIFVKLIAPDCFNLTLIHYSFIHLFKKKGLEIPKQWQCRRYRGLKSKMQSCASARSGDVQRAASTFICAVPVVLVEADGAGPRLGLGGGGGLHVGQVLGVPQVGQQVLQRRPVGPCVDGGQVKRC